MTSQCHSFVARPAFYVINVGHGDAWFPSLFLFVFKTDIVPFLPVESWDVSLDI